MSANNGSKTPHLARNKSAINQARRRRQVAELLERGDMTQVEIANFLGISQQTVCNDIKWLKEQAQTYVYDLAKSDLCYFYVSSIKDIDKARATAWEIVSKCTDKQRADKLAALKIIIQCDVERFKLLSEGPAVLSSKALSERVSQIEANINNTNDSDNDNESAAEQSESEENKSASESGIRV